MNERMMDTAKERRRSSRRDTLGIITISRSDDSDFCEGKIFNISEGGMTCATDIPLNILAQVDIKVEQSAELHRNKHYSGKVVWATYTGDLNTGSYLYGIKFI